MKTRLLKKLRKRARCYVYIEERFNSERWSNFWLVFFGIAMLPDDWVGFYPWNGQSKEEAIACCLQKRREYIMDQVKQRRGIKILDI